jgi:hypothetical protein
MSTCAHCGIVRVHIPLFLSAYQTFFHELDQFSNYIKTKITPKFIRIFFRIGRIQKIVKTLNN